MGLKKKRIIAFGWYGGKYSHLDWLLPLLPYTTHYCEPFAGSGAVLFNREPSPVETYNDLDGEVVNFFKVLRERKEELIEQIGLTPFSRKEYERALTYGKDNGEALDELERARKFFIRARQTRTGLAQKASIGRWANCKLTSRSGMSGSISRWLGSIDTLPAVAMRLIRVQIENLPASEVVRKYDSVETTFYCDPPYVHESRGDINAYYYEMSEEEHRELALVLHNCQGNVAISGYKGELMERLYGDWYQTIASPKRAHSVKKMRQEVLWTNYDPNYV